MNKPAINKLIETLRGLDDIRFDMTRWVHREGCGTVACIAGWVALTDLGDEVISTMRSGEIWDHAQERLGLSEEQSRALFMGTKSGERVVNLDRVSRGHAIKVLGILRDTGHVDWRLDMKERRCEHQED